MREEPPRPCDAAPGRPPLEPESSAADGPGLDPRFVDAWREWLGKLATDAEAALAAAMAYKELDDAGRDRWIGALEQDTETLLVPRIAVYAPLLAVETDGVRRTRIMDALGPDDSSATPRAGAAALRGVGSDHWRVAALITPLYLDFVQVLACGYHPEEGFRWVRHDPIVRRERTLQRRDELGGVTLESTPLKAVVDELAAAVLAHQRRGQELPEALQAFADLFGPCDTGSTVPPAP